MNMRIGINALGLWGKFSGVERSTLNLIKGMLKADMPIELIAYVPIEFDSSLLTFGTTPKQCKLKLKKLGIASRFRILRIICEQAFLPLKVTTDRLQLLHCPSYIAVLGSPLPVVLSLYDILAITHPEWCRTANRIHYRFMLPLSIKKAKRIIVPSESVKRSVISLFPHAERKVEVIPLGIDEIFFEPPNGSVVRHIQSKFGLPKRFILFVGNIEPKKNLPTLLEAYEVLKKMMDGIGLVIVGMPAWGDGKLVERAKSSGALCLGYVSDAILRALYSLASVLAFPSLYEGFGLPPLEAMAVGIPVVASNAGALPEVLGDAAILVEPNSVTQLAEALYKAITDEALRAKLIEKGKARAHSFSWVETARRVARVYEHVLKECA